MEKVLLRNIAVEDSHKLSVYQSRRGYKALEKALKEMTPDQVTEEVSASGLRGRGGAGFPTGRKWSFVPKDNPKPKYLIVNADESEPGTFKDRILIERDPHGVIEGAILAAYAIQSHLAFIYIRGEFMPGYMRLERALQEARQAGYLGKNLLGSG
jgi:NADH-quinone oxidoreductase subunit F